MNEQELSNLQGVRDRLIVDEVSHVADETFCLVVPIDGTNCGLLDSSPDHRGINLKARTYKTNKVPVVVCRPALRCLS